LTVSAPSSPPPWPRERGWWGLSRQRRPDRGGEPGHGEAAIGRCPGAAILPARRGDCDTEDTVAEALATITNRLEGESCYDDDAADQWHRANPEADEDDIPDFNSPAMQTLIDNETSDGNLAQKLANMKPGNVIELMCNNGDLKIIRER
jgi:hypothetical protein